MIRCDPIRRKTAQLSVELDRIAMNWLVGDVEFSLAPNQSGRMEPRF